MRCFVLCVAFVVVHVCAGAAASVTPAGVPFHLTPQGGVIVSVFLDAKGPFPFLLDTGSNGSVVSEALAASLAAPVVAATTLTSAIGQKRRLVARIGHLAIGPISASGVLATVMPASDFDLPDTTAGGDRVQGVVGQDVLANLRYTIDYRARRIVWRDGIGEIPERASVLALEPRDDRFLVVLPQGHSTLRLVPDSGSEGLVLFQRDGRVDPIATLAPDGAMVSGLAGAGIARRARVDALRLGTATLTGVPAVVVAGVPAAQTADGLLPLHLFARVTFNGPERQLVIERR